MPHLGYFLLRGISPESPAGNHLPFLGFTHSFCGSSPHDPPGVNAMGFQYLLPWHLDIYGQHFIFSSILFLNEVQGMRDYGFLL